MSRLADFGVVALVTAALVKVLGRTYADPDLWGHVRYGRDMLRDRELTRVDPYSYASAGQEWINHEWLSELTFGAVHRALGPSGLIGLKLVVVLLILLGALVFLRARGLPWIRGGVLVIVCALGIGPGVVAVRPQLFTFLFFFVTLLVLERAEEAGGRRWLWILPALFALWVNFHGGVLAGLALAAAWGAWRLFVERGRALPIVPPLAAAGLAPLINPYGWVLPAFLIRTATVPRPEITEWQPLELATGWGVTYAVLLGVAVAGLTYSGRPRRGGSLLLLGVLALLPFAAVRHLPLFALGVLVLAGEHVGSAWQRLAERRVARRRARHASPGASAATPALVAGTGVLAAIILVGAATPDLRCIQVDPAYQEYPAGAVSLIRDSGVSGRLAVEFNWGQYVLWHLGPRVQVGMDGRRETVYGEEAYRDYIQFARGRGDWGAHLRDHAPDMALLARGEPAANLLRLHPEWTVIHEDPTAVLFAAAGWPGAEALRAAVAGPGRHAAGSGARRHDAGGGCFR